MRKGTAYAMALALIACESDDSDATDLLANQPSEGGQCTTASDLASLDTEYGPDNEEPEELAAACSVICFFDARRLDCITACIAEGTGAELSTECSTCLALAAECASANCALECSIDVTSAECVACRCGENDEGQNCEELYEECSGILSPVCRQ